MRYAAGPHAGEAGGSETQEYVTEQTAAGLAAVFLIIENPWLDQGVRKAYSYESLKE